MTTQFIHKNWTFRNLSKNGAFLKAEVPGSVYNDLLLNKQIDDPYWRDNENKALPVMDDDFEYKTNFSPSSELLKHEQILLCARGLDTLAEVYINGKLLFNANNMHRIWEADIKKFLNKDDNELKIIFRSSVKFIAEANKNISVVGSSDCMDGFPQIRKAHCAFGWDWGPRLPDAGIWRDISLLGFSGARINGGTSSVYITQKHKNANGKKSVDLIFDIKPEFAFSKIDYAYSVTITAPDGPAKTFDNSPKKITLDNPLLWFPNGLGAQYLYNVKITLFENKKSGILDVWEKKIGLRTLTISRKKDSWGESFCHEVNGIKFFAMGADYIPEDCILSRITKERTRKLLENCVNANFNVIRVWGGGFYPNDFFYDICDELGLVIWQDFMFSCANYNLTDEFDENIRAEFVDNIKRIRHHASLGLWCGNNEMEEYKGYGGTNSQQADYIKIFEYIIPQELKRHDPNTFYWPSSPSSGGSFDKPNDPNRGDVHYWEVWHGNKPFSEYRKHFFRYLSEFGFQSFPCYKTIESFTLPEDRNIFSYVMEKHQRNDAANGKILAYLYKTFLYPTDFDTLLYASQLLQAEAIKYGVEHFRRNRGRCMGAVYWQLNDCWPVASWASVDYFGRWKALHYFAKRFFSPLMVSCEENSVLTQNTNTNRQPNIIIEKSFKLCVSNETPEKKNVTLCWAVRDSSAKIISENKKSLKIEAFSSQWLSKIECQSINENSEYLSYDLFEDGKKEAVSSGTVIFSLPKHFNWKNPALSYKIEVDEIIIRAENYAKSIEIQNKNADLILSDNYFDMNAGEKRVRIISGKPAGIKLRSVFNIR